jgi:hypothetical protein
MRLAGDVDNALSPHLVLLDMMGVSYEVFVTWTRPPPEQINPGADETDGHPSGGVSVSVSRHAVDGMRHVS